MGEFDSTKYKNEFNKEKYDRIALVVPKGTREKLHRYAARRGTTANAILNAYIGALIAEEKSDEEKSAAQIFSDEKSEK